MPINTANDIYDELVIIIKKFLLDEGYAVSGEFQDSHHRYIYISDSYHHPNEDNSERIRLNNYTYLVECEGTAKHCEDKLNKLILQEIHIALTNYMKRP